MNQLYHPQTIQQAENEASEWKGIATRFALSVGHTPPADQFPFTEDIDLTSAQRLRDAQYRGDYYRRFFIDVCDGRC